MEWCAVVRGAWWIMYIICDAMCFFFLCFVRSFAETDTDTDDNLAIVLS